MTATPTPKHADVSRARRRHVAILAFALVVRGLVLWGGAERLQADPDSYRQLAEAFSQHGTFGYPVRSCDSADARAVQPTAYRPPLYPLTLALAGGGRPPSIVAVALLHLLLGVATVELVYQLGRRWHSESVGVCAAALVACDPILLNQSTLVMTETLATFLAAAGLACLSRFDLSGNATRPSFVPAVGLAGGALALAALCRPTFVLWLVLVWAAIGIAAAAKRASWRAAVLFPLGAAVILGPWAIRNWVALGRPVVTTTHGGYTLWLGNNEDFYRFLGESRWGDTWDSRDVDAKYGQVREQLQDELAADAWARDQAVQTIRRQPGVFAYACLTRVGTLWGLVPHRVGPQESAAMRELRHTIGVWYAATFIFAAAGLWSLARRAWQRPWLWGLLLVAAFTLVHAVYWTNLRMRAPLMPVVDLWAAVGLAAVVGRIVGRREGGTKSEG